MSGGTHKAAETLAHPHAANSLGQERGGFCKQIRSHYANGIPFVLLFPGFKPPLARHSLFFKPICLVIPSPLPPSFLFPSLSCILHGLPPLCQPPEREEAEAFQLIQTSISLISISSLESRVLELLEEWDGLGGMLLTEHPGCIRRCYP